MKKFLSVILVAWIVLNQSAPFVYAASNSTKITFPKTQVNSLPQVVPDVSTAVSTTDTYIFQITAANVTASAVTFTVTDRQTVPLDLLKSVSIAANTTYVIAFPEGVKMKNGFTWISGTTSALNGSVVAFKI